MAIIYQTNFDADTAGLLPSGWANAAGTWAARASGAVTAPNCLASSTNADQDVALYTGIAARADMDVTFSMKQASAVAKLPLMGVVVRAAADNSSNYTIVFPGTNGSTRVPTLFRKSGATYTKISDAGTIGFVQATGDTILIRVKIVGSTIEVYLGNGSLPSTPTATFTDSTVTSAGYAGLYNGKDGTTTSMGVDDFQIDDMAAAGSTVTGVSVSPSTATVAGGGQQQFASTVSGTNSPSQSVTWSATSGAINSSGLFTAPAATTSAQSVTVTATSTQDGTKSSTATVTVPAVAQTANNALLNATANVLFSPYNWNIQASSAKTINAGAYFKTVFSGTTCLLNFDMTGIASPVPQISYRVDRFGPWITVPIAAAVTITVPPDTSGYADKPGHLLEVIVKSMTETQPRWSTQATAVSLTGIILDAGKVLRTPTKLPLKAIFFGDSITEGVRTLNSTANGDTNRNDAGQCWSLEVGRILGAEVGNVGFGAAGFIATGSGSVPALPNSYNLLYAGVARSFSPEPDFIVLMEGTNDSGNVTSAATAVLNGLLAATSATKIIVLRPFKDATHAASLQAAIAACSAPARCNYVDTTGYFTTANSSDNLHPYGVENLVNIAPRVANAVRAVLSGAAVPPTMTARTVSLVLGTSTGPAANLAGLRVAFHDEASPALLTVPRFQSAVETTDSAGVLTFVVNSTLAAGGTGHLTVLGAADVHFNGPVQVS